MKKFVKIAAIVVAVVLVIALVAPMVLRGKIAEIVKREANAMLDARLDFEKLDISLLRHFPRASLDLKGLTLAWYDAPSGRKAWIEDVVVDGAARGCGAGDALVRAAVEHAARIGAGKVMLTSNPAREAARALYRKVGFEEVETTVFAFKTDK